MEYYDNSHVKKFMKLFTRDRAEAMRILEGMKDRCNVASYSYEDLRTPVHYASQDGDHKTLVRLMELGASVWGMCKGKFYPLHLAVLNGRVKIVKILLSREIPSRVLETITKAATYESDRPCIFYSAVESHNLDILKVLVYKFFPLVDSSVMRFVIGEMIDRMEIKNIKSVLEKSREGMRELAHVSSLIVAIQTHIPEDDKTTYILEIGKYGYHPLDMSQHHEILESYIMNCPDNYILKLLIRHKCKVINMHTPELLLYALRYKNLEAIDILFAIRCDPNLVSEDEEFEPEVIHKLVLRGDCKLINTENTTKIANEFRKQLTLFDMCNYLLYLSTLKRKLRYDGSRKRQRQ